MNSLHAPADPAPAYAWAEPLSPAAIDALLERIAASRVAVVGDFCLDAYWSLDMSRSEPSIETGAATFPVRAAVYSLGGAGNAANNLKALGLAHVSAFGMVGADPWGRELKRLMDAAAIDSAAVLEQGVGFSTLAYVKTYQEALEQSRHDFGNFNWAFASDAAAADAAAADAAAADADRSAAGFAGAPDADRAADRLLSALGERLGEFAVVAVNEQVSTGIHTPRFRAGLASLMEAHPKVIFLVDSRHHSGEYPGAWLKLNDREALRLCGMAAGYDHPAVADRPAASDWDPDRDQVFRAAETLFQRQGKPVFVTRGRKGILLWDSLGPKEIPGIRPPGVVDTVGAGDSALAGIASALSAGASPLEAAWIGNLAAAVTVRKLRQTGTATPGELRAAAASAVYELNPDLADGPRRAMFIPGTDIETIQDIPQDFRMTHAVFDHDGTISTLRQGWENIMEPLMVSCILGPRSGKTDPELFHTVKERVRDFIDRTTGIQTLLQMRGLVDLVKEFGCVVEQDILDMRGYKNLYNKALMEQVDSRTERLGQGELDAEDFTMKNSRAFLDFLRRRGVKLYLASGTDQEDLRREAQTLGYGGLFEGRIYGATGDVDQEAKRQVLERILGEIGGDAVRGVAVFGDGPVELREARRVGAIAVGVVSDELRRWGVNPQKRSRLIRAGAHLLIPDFTRMDALRELFHFN